MQSAFSSDLALLVMHRDKRFFDNPEQFLPERWKDNLEQRLPRCAYFPFGAGPRVCIGKTFSMMEAILTLAMTVQKFSFTLVQQHSIELLPSITLRPKQGVKMMGVASLRDDSKRNGIKMKIME